MQTEQSGFLQKIRRRKVGQWGVAFAAGAWGLLQGLEYVTATFDWPQRIQQFATLGLLLGLPMVLVIAWYHGDRGHQRVTMPEFVLLTGLFLVGGGIFWRYAQHVEAEPHAVRAAAPAETPVPPANSIAVLPFADLSETGDQQYFSDGIAEEILNALVGVEGLRVTSRTSAFKYRGDTFSVPEIAAALSVRHLVEGSVRRSGSMVRITAQLIDSTTDTHLWSETYDRPLTAENLFGIQSEIATAIVQALGNKLGTKQPASVRIDGGTTELDTYETFLRASELFRRRSRENLPETIAMLENVVEDDPGFARAWAGLAYAYRVAPGWGIEGRDWDSLATQAADRATSIDGRLAVPFLVRSTLNADRYRWDEALKQAAAAIERESSNPDAWYVRAHVHLRLGYFETARRDFEQCLLLEPEYEICRRFLALSRLYAGHTDEALELFELSLSRNQDSYTTVFAPVYAARGNHAAALMLMAHSYGNDGGWQLEPDYRFLTEPGYSVEQYRADLRRRFAMEFPDENPTELLDLSGLPEPAEAANDNDLPLILLWSPYWPGLQRSELREATLATRDRWFRAAGLDDYWREHEFPPQCRPAGKDGFRCD